MNYDSQLKHFYRVCGHLVRDIEVNSCLFWDFFFCLFIDINKYKPRALTRSLITHIIHLERNLRLL